MRTFGGPDFCEVPIGTEFKDAATGETYVVTDETAVLRENHVYVTKSMMKRILAHPDVKRNIQ